MSMEIIPVTMAGEGESSRPAADRLIAGEPVQRAWNAFSDVSEQFHAGHWSSSRGVWRVRYTECELCVLITGRQLEHWHTGSMTRRAGVLDALEPEAIVTLHPEDYAALNPGPDGLRVRLETRRGQLSARARPDPQPPPTA